MSQLKRNTVLIVMCLSLFLTVRTGYCQETDEGLTHEEAVLLFDRIDFAQYRIEILEEQVAYCDTLRMINDRIQKDIISEKSRTLTNYVVGALFGAALVWVGSSL